MPTDKKLYSKEDLFQMMCVALGGRAAEAVVFNRITTGMRTTPTKGYLFTYSHDNVHHCYYTETPPEARPKARPEGPLSRKIDSGFSLTDY